MKREKEQWLRIFNGVMFGALILLGFAYCDENSMGAGSENCTSYAKYEFRGKVLGESRQVVPDAGILVKHIASPADHMAMLFYPIRFIPKKTESIFIRIP